MSDTPRTDGMIFPTLNPALEYVNAPFARQLETELATVTAERDAWALAAAQCGLCRSDTDVSTAEKWKAAQLKAATDLLADRDRLRAALDMIAEMELDPIRHGNASELQAHEAVRIARAALNPAKG